MPCKSCGSGFTVKPADANDWLSREEVRDICPQCYENMITNNISRIKKSVLASKLEENKTMKYYEVTYTGPAKSKFNFGGHSLDPFIPQYFLVGELPYKIKDIKGMSFIQISEVEVNSKPSEKDAKIAGAKIAGTKGIMWTGSSPRRVNEYGSFIRDEPRFDLTPEAFNALSKLGGFKVVG